MNRSSTTRPSSWPLLLRMARPFAALALGATLAGAAAAQTLPNGGSVQGVIATPLQRHTYSFFALAGEGLQLRIADLNRGALYPRITLNDPTGAYFTHGDGPTVAAVIRTAPLTGIYTVEVSNTNNQPNAIGPYELHFTRAPGANEGGSLPNGGRVSGSLGLGDLDSYTFTAQTGQGLQLRMADLSRGALYPRIYLYAPDGSYFTYDDGPTVASIIRTAPQSGTYTVVVLDASSYLDATGDYTLELVRAPGANEGGALPNGGSVSSTLDLGDLDSYTFSAQAGEGFHLRVADLATAGLYPQIYLYAPNGSYLTYDNGPTIASIIRTAPQSGTYTVVVLDASSYLDQSGAYTLEFVRAPGANEGGSLPNGGAIQAQLELGDLDSYSFSISRGEGFQLRLSDSASAGFYPQIYLYAPDGSYVTYDNGPTVATIERTAAQSGTYTVVILDASSYLDQSGPYRLEFVRAPGASEHGFLRDAVPQSESIDLGDLDSYSFLALANQTATVTVTDNSASTLDPIVWLYGPDGDYITYASGPLTATLSRRLTRPGIYTLLVTDASSYRDGVGAYTIELRGSGEDPSTIQNLIGVTEYATDPVLSDVGGDPAFGPRIGSANEPFNVSLDCRAASAPSIAAIQLWTSYSTTPLPTTWGHFYARGSIVVAYTFAHSRDVQTWFPTGTGFVLPNDPLLVGGRFTVQGFVAGIGTLGRFSNALTQTIRG